jgi:hypothetical protein
MGASPGHKVAVWKEWRKWCGAHDDDYDDDDNDDDEAHQDKEAKHILLFDYFNQSIESPYYCFLQLQWSKIMAHPHRWNQVAIFFVKWEEGSLQVLLNVQHTTH